VIPRRFRASARGGVVVAVHEAIDVPIKFLGTGEQSGDLVPFEATSFARELLGDE
jgi:fused signal recognition particle receptor